jgi:hypothetical protein
MIAWNLKTVVWRAVSITLDMNNARYEMVDMKAENWRELWCGTNQIDSGVATQLPKLCAT